ncbi:MAG: hypothetical protein RLZZ584_778 [Pseudomonadota bacterium]
MRAASRSVSSWVAAVVLCGLLLQPAQGQTGPLPPGPGVTEVLHGVTVPDPFRRLEDQDDPATRAWLQAQGAHARAELARIDGRERLGRRIATLLASVGDQVQDIRRLPGERIWYLKRRAGESQYKLMLRQGEHGAERVIVDPQQLMRSTGVPHAINYWQPSWDGRTLAYGLSAGGSEDAALHLLDVASGRAIGQAIPRVHEALLHWTPDSRALSFNQVRVLPPGTPDTETFLDTATLLLRPGRPGEPAVRPVPLFGPLIDRQLGLDRLDVGEVLFAPGSRWMIARTTDTTVPEGRLYVAPLAQLDRAVQAVRRAAAGPRGVRGATAGTGIEWRAVATAADKVTAIALAGDTLYLRSYAGASNGRVLALALPAVAAPGAAGRAEPALARAVEVVPEPASGVLEDFALAPGAIYTELKLGFGSRVRRHALSGQGAALKAGEPVDLAPQFEGSTLLISEPAQQAHDAWIATASWLDTSRALAVGPQGVLRDTGLRDNPRPPAAADLQVTELLLPSHDGAQVPLAIVHRKGLALDGSHPTLLVGYGAYGVSLEARLDVRSLAWLEQGGVLAYANVRGSGAFGDAWHRAGFKASKPNTWKDGIACAQHLIAHGYTNPGRLGIWGTSAGGIFVGRAVTSAPQLFAAAIFDVGVMDAVRAEESANGITNISEFGSNRNPDEFPALLEMSTYHQIRDGVPYPAVLLIHGMNDPRVDVWHSAKAAARLQQASSSGKPVLLRLDGQAGHGVGSTAQQGVDKLADIYSFLLWQFGLAEQAPQP